jgi:serine/threonine-protein kinase RsbW
MASMRRSFSRKLTSLASVFEFIDEFKRATRIPEASIFPMRFAAEEIFTNLVKYNASSTSDIEIRFAKEGEKMVLDFIDQADQPFDLSKVPEVDITRPIEELEPGGLGIHLTKKLMDEIRYTFDQGRSCTTLIKDLRKK